MPRGKESCQVCGLPRYSQTLQTLQIHPGLRGFVANSSRNSSVHLGFLLDARTEVLVGTGFPHHLVMKENTQPFQ